MSAMRKDAIRLSIAILTFCLGTASVYLPVLYTQVMHSSDLPYSILEGSTVRIRPYEATFQIPESWLIPGPFSVKNLHLSRRDLNLLYWNDGGDAEDAQVINAVLPFEHCAAHFGSRDWGNHFWNDLQGRVYVVDSTPAELAEAIETNGLAEASSVFEGAELSGSNFGSWRKLTIEIVDAPTHFILMKRLDFYHRPLGTKTVVFVFLHAGGFDPTIERILNSFDWCEDPVLLHSAS
jgi:hypothetical protein